MSIADGRTQEVSHESYRRLKLALVLDKTLHEAENFLSSSGEINNIESARNQPRERRSRTSWRF